MLMLPKHIGAVALGAAKEGTRFALSGVRVQEFQDDVYRLSATDGRVLVVVRGTGQSGKPYGSMLESANDCWDYLVPATTWKKAFGDAKNHECVGLVADAEAKESRLALPGSTVTAPFLDGRSPAIDEVFPKKPAVVALRFTPSVLLRALTAAKSLLGEEDCVWLLFWGDGKAIGIRGRRGETGEDVDVLVMPNETKNDPSRPTEPEEPEPPDEDNGPPEDGPGDIDPTDPAGQVEAEAEGGQAETNGYHQPALPGSRPSALPNPTRVVRAKPAKKPKARKKGKK